ncbi:hypothetical protein [Candidatus Nitrosocosmicus sp. SS]|uniref:hypothetical protein n=1 Tax=Candidatus Nitrosocosmicus agrestis TaxID=2563600 RepID=UPI0012B5E7F5|nr:hypothetical protein [Candidatus Nitrosocosmicus sp. SS]
MNNSNHSYSNDANNDKNTKETKKCIICGCTGHSLFGCISHWRGHKENNGLCNKQ